MRPTEVLSQEHRVIEQVLRCLVEMASRAASGEVEVEPAEAALRFLGTFADACHHKKEEEVLFPALARRGFGPEAGPVAVMLEEHELGRKYLARIDAAVRGARRGDPGAPNAFAAAVRAYADLLAQHISKEDHILFPLADHALGPADGEALRSAFADAEARLGHGRLHEEMLRVADDLGRQFGVGRNAGPAAFHGCCHGPAPAPDALGHG